MTKSKVVALQPKKEQSSVHISHQFIKKKSFTNQELATHLKKVYGINRNIAQILTKEQKEELLFLLVENKTVLTLVETFVQKNQEISQNNRQFGRQRERVKKELEVSKSKNQELLQELSSMRRQLIVFKKQIYLIMENIHYRLLGDLFDRSEIIYLTRELLKSLKG